jgi:GABA(A) receptor-associated protein
MEERLFLTYGEADRLRAKFPGKIPIFVTRGTTSRDIPDLPKHKFLAPSHLSVGQFIYVIRRHMSLPPEKALFVFVDNTLPTSSSLLSELYATYKSPDGALRLTYTSENTFGFSPYSSCSFSFLSFLLHPFSQKYQLEPPLP